MPLTGKYRIKAAGAGNEDNGTFGAVVKCSIKLEEAQVLQIAVGQYLRFNIVEIYSERSINIQISGQCAQSKKCGSGGTFVALFNEAAEVTWKPLLIAGGAGGAIKFLMTNSF